MKEINSYKGLITLLKLFALIAVIFISYYVFLQDEDIPVHIHNYEICSRSYNKEYKGTILKNYRTIKGGYYSDLSNNDFYRWRCWSKVTKLIYQGNSIFTWELLKVGDSLYKPSNTFNVYIYKKANPDSVIFVECDYSCEEILMYQENVPLVEYIKNKDSVSLEWNFNSEYEKYLKQILLIKEYYINGYKQDTIILKPNIRKYKDVNLQTEVQIQYWLVFKYINNKYREGNITYVPME